MSTLLQSRYLDQWDGRTHDKAQIGTALTRGYLVSPGTFSKGVRKELRNTKNHEDYCNIYSLKNKKRTI